MGYDDPKKLRRSKTNKIFLGVCGGIGEYLNVDPTLIRIIWICLFFAYGLGIFAYIIVAVIMNLGQKSDIDVWK